ncbi:MAG: GxxExxY protein [Niastella sp.]|nr:GxxExxY protein [Niastella sp.]
MADIILKDESYKLIGICMEVHRNLGMGFREIVYKDALEVEFKNNFIPFCRERAFKIEYKGLILKHRFYADFIVFDNIVLEVKSSSVIINSFVAQTINYLKASGLKLGIIANFGESSFTYKRVVF